VNDHANRIGTLALEGGSLRCRGRLEALVHAARQHLPRFINEDSERAGVERLQSEKDQGGLFYRPVDMHVQLATGKR
jgi:hypothetical protein